MKFKNLNIIGCGPNAVYALEILLKKILKLKTKKKRKIRIFEETGLLGCGKTHSKKLNKNILLNRVAGQISLGSYPFIKFPKNLRKFDYNFMEWKNNSKVKKIKNLISTDWPSRYIFGLSLEDKLHDILKIYSKYTNIQIEIYIEKVTSIKKLKKNYEIITSKGKKFQGDKFLVVSGNYIPSNHSSKLSKKISKLIVHTNCSFEYNFLKNLDDRNYWDKFKKKNIVIYGTGVSSLDVITMLNKNYNKIFPCSRTFLFPFARPLNQKLLNPQKYEHKEIIFNKKFVNSLKKKINQKKIQSNINIENTLLPFLKAEFYLIYFEKFLKKKKFSDFRKFIKKKLDFKKIDYKLDFTQEDNLIDDYIRNMLIENSFNRKFYFKNWFSRKKIIKDIINKKFVFFDFFSNPLINENNNFLNEYTKFLNWDINEAKKGNLSSPFKKACDGLWRDLRPHLTNLFDDCSHEKMYKNFIKKILPIHNRLADGPSVKMIIKIKKLIKKKIINFDLKNQFKFVKKNKNLYLDTQNKKIKINFIFSAIANIYKENIKKDELLTNMYKNNLISFKKDQTQNYLFLNLNKKQSPYNIFGKKINDITFIGPASEGTKFFHHTLSRPDKKQFNIKDLERWVRGL